MTPADRLAEATRRFGDHKFNPFILKAWADVRDALAAYDADKARREAEQAVVAGSKAWQEDYGEACGCGGIAHADCGLVVAVLRLRELEAHASPVRPAVAGNTVRTPTSGGDPT